MAGSVIPATEEERMLSSFLEIAVDLSPHTAVQLLGAAGWNLEKATDLYFTSSSHSGQASLATFPTPFGITPTGWGNNDNVGEDGDATQNPSERGDEEAGEDGPDHDGATNASEYSNEEACGDEGEDNDASVSMGWGDEEAGEVAWHDSVLHDDARRDDDYDYLRNSEEGTASYNQLWRADQSDSREGLTSLYRPPFPLIYSGSFHMAKAEGASQNRWLLIDVQSSMEFSSHLLNRDTWPSDSVQQTIRSAFIFWQADHGSSEGVKVCTFYNLVAFPCILVIDPITGRKMHASIGFIEPEFLLDNLLPFMDKSPRENLSRRVDYLEEKIEYLPLPEEPRGDEALTCRVGIRLPDGRRLVRNFLRADPIKLLWSFCAGELEEGETRQFYFILAIPGASKTLDYESNLTIEESGLLNSMVSLILE